MHAYWPRSGTDVVVGLNSLPLEDHSGRLLLSLYRTLHSAGLA
jgi:hypothetical protein